MNLSVRLQELRQKSKISQEELAEKLGVSRQAVSKWESEQSNPDLNNIIKLSEVYNTSTDYILKGAEPALISVSNKTMIDNRNTDKDSAIGKVVVCGVLGILGVATVLVFLFCSVAQVYA